jgi:U3 small nucleolar RNA-associated protein 10
MQGGALNLFGEQLPKMAEKFRREITPAVNKIIKRVEGILSTDEEQALTTSALKALKAMGDTVCAGEETSLSDTVPLVLTMMKGQKNTEFAVSALASISCVRSFCLFYRLS